MSDVKAVVFDLGKVLLDFDYRIAAERLSRESSVSPAQVQEFIDHSPLLCQYEKGQITRADFFNEVCRLTRYRGSLEQFSAWFSAVFTPIEPMIQLQGRLADAGISTFIFSNTNDLAIDHIRNTYPFYSRFNGYVLSYEHGFMKPDPPLYQILEEACGQTGSQICYLDDRAENVRVGLERGWRALVHKDTSDSVRWVETLCFEHGVGSGRQKTPPEGGPS